MKKFFFTSACFAFLLFACSDFSNLQIPESVSVKSSAVFELPVGQSIISLHEKLSVSKLQGIINDNIGNSSSKKPVIYDYNPTLNDEDTLKYIVDYPVEEFSLSAVDTSSDIDEITFSTDFNLNINDKVKDTFDFESASGGLPVPDLGDGKEYSISGIPLNLSTELDFKTVELSAGTISLVITKPDSLPSPAGIELTVKAQLYSGSRLVDEKSKDCTEGGSLSFNLAGKTLDSSGVRLVISAKYKDTDSSPSDASPYSYAYSASTSGIKVAKITGLNMSADDIGDVVINDSKAITGLNNYVVSAKIGKGKLSFGAKLPEGWSGIKYEEANSSIGVAQSSADGLEIENSEFKTVGGAQYIINKEVDLSGKSLNSSNVDITGSVKFSLKNANLVFTGDNEKITISGACKIDELSEITINLSSILGNYSDTVETGIDFSTILSDILQNDENLIKNVKFKGLEGYVFVNQPTTNSVLESLSAKAGISASYDNGSEVLIPSNSTISVKSGKATLASLADKNALITENWTGESDYDKQIFSKKVNDNVLDTIINSQPSNLSFSYNLDLASDSNSNITLTGDDIEALKKGSSISIHLALVIPFEIVLADVSDGVSDYKITIPDVLALIGNEFTEDALHRDEDWDSDNDKYLDAIKSISFNYTLKNTTPMEKITLTFYDDGGIIKTTAEDGTSTPGKSLKTKNGSDSLLFTGDEVKEILHTRPFIPKVKMEIEGADGLTPRSFARNSVFSLLGSISIKTDGTVELWNKNDKDK